MRREPYTEAGIKRVKCLRCGEQASQQWQICADGNQYRPICNPCDVKLNKLVLKFMRFKDWRVKLAAYKENITKQS